MTYLPDNPNDTQQESSAKVRGRLFTRARMAAVAALAMMATLVTAVPARAATPTTTLAFSGDHTIQARDYSVGCNGCIPGDNGLGARFHVDISADWRPTATISHQYSASLIRQGETLDLTNTLTPGSGPLTVRFGVTGDAGVYNFDGAGPKFPEAGSEQDIASYGLGATASTTCALKLDGDGNYNCSATKEYTLYDATFLGQGMKVTLPITASLVVTPDGVVSVRSVTVGGQTYAGPDNLGFHGPSPAVLADNFAVPCTAPVGTELLYDLASSSTSPQFEATTSVGVKISITVIFTTESTVNLASIGPDTSAFALAAPSNQVELGPIQPDNKPPVITAPSSYSGSEGAAIQFSAAGTTDNCAATLSYRWNFSDGGTAFGISPKHTFADNGTYSGELKVTDAAGNSATKDFSVEVTNVAPSAQAGPDTTAAWGRNVAFNGAGTDPGAADQPTLTYNWSFGDGSPSATGGPSVTHAYSTPGTYTATFVVCDKDGACSAPDTREVTVRARNVSVGYTGDHNGTYDTLSRFSAALVDEFGQAVPGRTTSFTVGGQDAGSAATSSSGVASKSSIVGLAAGAHSATASFAGDALYNTAAGTGAFTVAKKGSSVTYTGSVTGGANKVITLSAVLKDAEGKPLPGRTIVFVLGSQTASATTDAYGVAATTLKLAQKNGTYTLTSTWTPSGADDPHRYVGSAASATFKLQAR